MLSLIVGLYLAVLLGIGWWCHRTRISGMTDFLLAGRRLGVLLCAAAMAATPLICFVLLPNTLAERSSPIWTPSRPEAVTATHTVLSEKFTSRRFVR